MLNKMENKSLLLIAIMILGIVFISGCVQEETPTKIPATQPTQTQQTTQSEAPSELSLKIGETAKTSKIEVTVISARKTTFYEYYSDILKETMVQEASPGKIYILVEAEIKNIGADSVYVGSSKFSVTDSEGYRYDPELYYGDDGLEMIKELYRDQKMRGKILFEVPETASGLKVQYDFGNLFIGTKLASWSIE